MLSAPTSLALLLLASAPAALAQYTATYTPGNAPAQTEEGQSGTNQCGTGSDQNSMCQNAYINSISDFCLWAPPSTTSVYGDSSLGNTERIVVSWCLQGGRGTRIIPDGTISGAHFLITSKYVQVTGQGDLTKLNIPAGDDGGELDPHGADGNGNPVGGLVFSSAFGNGEQQIHEWTSYMSAGVFGFKACAPGDSEAADYCQHIYDVLGSGFTIPGDYGAGSFDECLGDPAEKPGVYGGSTFHQGDPTTPAPHAPAATSMCTYVSTVQNGMAGVNAVQPTANSAVADSSLISSSLVPSASSRFASSAMQASASASSASASGSSASASASSSMASSTSASSSTSSVKSMATRSSSSSSSSSRSAAAAAASSSSSIASGAESQVGVLLGSAIVGIIGFAGIWFI